jgi:hypothetical protein
VYDVVEKVPSWLWWKIIRPVEKRFYFSQPVGTTGVESVYCTNFYPFPQNGYFLLWGGAVLRARRGGCYVDMLHMCEY